MDIHTAKRLQAVIAPFGKTIAGDRRTIAVKENNPPDGGKFEKLLREIILQTGASGNDNGNHFLYSLPHLVNPAGLT
jgi:hypothetical protein